MRGKDFQIEVEPRTGATVVHCQGVADIFGAESMKARLEELCDLKLPKLIIDLTGVTFICSTGLSAIIASHLKSRAYSGSVRLVNPQPAVQSVLETTGLSKLFPIYPTVEQAML